MGLPTQALYPICHDHKHTAFEGPLLVLGQPHFTMRQGDAPAFLRMVGIEPDPRAEAALEPGADLNARAFFGLLGIHDVEILDVDPYQGAEIIVDLNEPIPKKYHGRFKTVLDSGTMEHVFDLRTGLSNLVKLLAVGGRVVHQNPCNNYVNHGFFQVSPTLYFDYYAANGFDDLRACFVVQPRSAALTTAWNFVAYHDELFWGLNSVMCPESTQLGLHFHARKKIESKGTKAPIQHYFQRFAAKDRAWLANQRRFVIRHTPEAPQLEDIGMLEP
ncbi:MAG: hypothetical protein JO140_04745 [Candidatus Eremiobacteraeota bacterium]|nr:hypothetical protein [Candidatus Eremiobacteraeota bacterium]